MDSPWLDGWRNRALKQVRQCGFDSLTDYLKNRGVSSVKDLCKQLDVNLAPIQVEKMLRDEASDSNGFQFFARAILVLGMHRKCTQGWWKCVDFDRTLVMAHWGGGLGEINSPQVGEVSRRLRDRTDLPETWLPSGVDDPVMVAAFEGIEFRNAVPGPP